MNLKEHLEHPRMGLPYKRDLLLTEDRIAPRAAAQSAEQQTLQDMRTQSSTLQPSSKGRHSATGAQQIKDGNIRSHGSSDIILVWSEMDFNSRQSLITCSAKHTVGSAKQF